MANPYDEIDPPAVATQPTAGVNPYDEIDPPGFDSTAGGAAIIRPRNPPRPLRRPASEVLTDIGGATALGAGMGLVAPEIIQGVGLGFKAIPTPLTQAIVNRTHIAIRTGLH